jgi:CheY-like chemotaxis protein
MARRRSGCRPIVRRRILVVDDDEMIAEAIQCVLDAYETEIACDGGSALERLRNGPDFDLILCDLMMPLMTGMELYDALESELPELVSRIVFMSGSAYTADAREFVKRHQSRFIEKPFDCQTLRSCVDAFFAKEAMGRLATFGS